MIISSIAKCKDVDFNKKPKSFVYENIENEQFSLEEIKDKRDEEFVPGIKELSVYALENYDKYIWISKFLLFVQYTFYTWSKLKLFYYYVIIKFN